MATLRELKGRIGSVASSEKITGAMKMISSAKMHKFDGALKRLKPYRAALEGIAANMLASDADFASALTEPRQVSKATIVVLGSDDGLCGAYNANIAKFVEARLSDIRKAHGEDVQISVIPVGKKLAKAVTRLKSANVAVERNDVVDSKSEGEAVKTFEKQLVNAFTVGGTDEVYVAYMNFKTAGRQVATFDRFLPLDPAALTKSAKKVATKPYLFEPGPNEIFQTLIPMYLLSMMQEVFVENRASEQAARVMAMQAANDNAKKLLDQLRLEYNKLRQQSITTELLDIVGGQARD